jgi:acyl carrier protein
MINQDSNPNAPVASLLTQDSPLEQELSRLWGDVLGVPNIDRDDDFFDLGGHSLMAVDLKARIRAALGVAHFPLDLLATPTIATMSGAILLHLKGVREMTDGSTPPHD